MNKKRLLALVFGLMLSFSGYAQSNSEAQPESKGSFFFSGGVYNGFFSNPLVLLSNFEVRKLFAGIASGNYELPMGPGNIALGLEAGYSSGSKFGGKGDVDFIPFGINAAYVFPLTSFFYIGPRVRIGGLGLLGPDWNKVIFSTGARLEAELRSTGFPIGLFVAGGVDIFPFAPQLATLPVIEAGIRFPRGKLKKSGSTGATKNKEPEPTPPVTPTAVTTAPSVPPPVEPQPVEPAAIVPATNVPQPEEPAPAEPAAIVAAPNVPQPEEPAPAEPVAIVAATNVPQPEEPTPAEPAAIVAVPEEAAPVEPAAIVAATNVPQPEEPAPAEPAAIVVVPEEAAPTEPVLIASVPAETVPTEPATIVPTPVTPTTPPTIVPPPVVPASVETQAQRPPLQGISGASQAQNIYLILDDGREGVLNSIYFEPDTAVLIELYRSVLNAVGRRMAADSSLNLLIRAYTADFGTIESQYVVSSDRDVFSRNYLATEYGISASRFSSELYGSDRSPKYATEDWKTHRCVELILVRD